VRQRRIAFTTLRWSQVSHFRLSSKKLSPAARMMSATSTGGRGILRRAGARGEHRQGIQGAGGSAQMPLRHMDINGGLLQIAVAEENLDGAQVGAGLHRWVAKQ
jgi:hypothetical protein